MIISKILSSKGATLSYPSVAFSERLLVLIFGCFTLLVCCSCGSTKVATQIVEHTSIDTVYLSNIQYDSIYIYKDKLTDRSKDTIYVKDVSVEYRYKLLRDTIYKTQVDSIPYQVTVTEVKEITRPLTFYDHLTRLTFWLVVGSLLSFIAIKLKNVFKR